MCELIGDTKTDELGREYDTSEKPYKVLCRSGWVHPNYIYRHKTNKPLYTISEGDMSVTVTEDHSLFNNKQEKIKPSEITQDTKLEYYTGSVKFINRNYKINDKVVTSCAKLLMNGSLDRVPVFVLNGNNELIGNFIKAL